MGKAKAFHEKYSGMPCVVYGKLPTGSSWSTIETMITNSMNYVESVGAENVEKFIDLGGQREFIRMIEFVCHYGIELVVVIQPKCLSKSSVQEVAFSKRCVSVNHERCKEVLSAYTLLQGSIHQLFPNLSSVVGD